MLVVGTEFYNTFREKEHLISKIKRQFEKVRLYFEENLIIYEYDDGIKQEKPTYKLVK